VKANREKQKLIIALRRQLTKAKQDLTEAQQVISEMDSTRLHQARNPNPGRFLSVISYPPIIEGIIISRPFRDAPIDVIT
jgi:hypothetical protein